MELTEIAQKASKIKVSKKINSSAIENAPFFKKKMSEATRIISVAGLPK